MELNIQKFYGDDENDMLIFGSFSELYVDSKRMRKISISGVKRFVSQLMTIHNLTIDNELNDKNFKYVDITDKNVPNQTTQYGWIEYMGKFYDLAWMGDNYHTKIVVQHTITPYISKSDTYKISTGDDTFTYIPSFLKIFYGSKNITNKVYLNN